jgi:hypothetical protein
MHTDAAHRAAKAMPVRTVENALLNQKAPPASQPAIIVGAVMLTAFMMPPAMPDGPSELTE